MRLLALPRYATTGASSRVRLYQFLPYLSSVGIDVDCQPLLDDAHVAALRSGQEKRPAALTRAFVSRLLKLVAARRYDLLWIEKEIFPWLPDWVESALGAAGIPYVVDYDDAWFHHYDLHPRALVRWILGRKLDRVMRRARLVVAGNAYLAARARAAGARWVVEFPSVVDTERYRMKGTHSPGKATIVWIGSPTTTRYLALQGDALRSVCNGGRAELLLIGAGPIDLPRLDVRSIDWSYSREGDLLAAADIGIMPQPDGPWERGKCGYKLLQYMASGLPTVASPVGANLQIVTPETGILAGSAAEWREALERLIVDPAMRTRMGLAGRRRAEKMYSLAVWGPELAALLRAAVSAGSERPTRSSP